MRRRTIIALISVIVLFNIGNWLVESASVGIPKHYESESGKFQFRAVPSKGRDVAVMEREYRSYWKETEESEEQIYRIQQIELLKL